MFFSKVYQHVEKNRSRISCSLTSSLGVGRYFFVKGTSKVGGDGRQAIALHRDERNLVLSGMRQLLAGVQRILEALSRNDLKVVEMTASSLGMKAAADVNPVLMAKLPLEFKSSCRTYEQGSSLA